MHHSNCISKMLLTPYWWFHSNNGSPLEHTLSLSRVSRIQEMWDWEQGCVLFLELFLVYCAILQSCISLKVNILLSTLWKTPQYTKTGLTWTFVLWLQVSVDFQSCCDITSPAQPMMIRTFASDQIYGCFKVGLKRTGPMKKIEKVYFKTIVN